MLGEKSSPDTAASLGGEFVSGLDDVAALPARLDRYAIAHARTLNMSKYIKKREGVKQNRDLLTLLDSCGSYLCFHDYYTVGKIRLAAASFCNKHLLCPLCAIRRGAKSLQAYVERLQVVKEGRTDLHPYLVTLTVKNGANLEERFEHVKKSMAKMQEYRRDWLKGKGAHYEICKAEGGVGSVEFKRGSGSKLWHPHAHAVWLCSVPPCEKTLSVEWKRITGDSHIVNVTPFHSEEDMVSGFCEVFKYALKFSSMGYADNFQGYLVLSGRRLVSSFGVMRGVVIPENLTDEPLHDLPYLERFYVYANGGGYGLGRKPQLMTATGAREKTSDRGLLKNPVVRPNGSLNSRRFVSFEVSRVDNSQ